MRVAVITDIHGNSHALEAILADLEHRSVDEVVIAGDTINLLPHSRRCWDIVNGLDAHVLQGNHEFTIANLEALKSTDLAYSSERFMPTRACAAQFSKADAQAMLALPLVVRFPGLLIAHASPNDVFAHVREHTPPEELRAMFAGSSEGLIVRGHNHEWLERRFDDRMVATVGSGGMPVEGQEEAQYAVLTKAVRWSIERRFVTYDRQALLVEMDAEAYLETHGPLARILRQEVLTARNHWMPFLERYAQAVELGALSLAEAVNQYLETV